MLDTRIPCTSLSEASVQAPPSIGGILTDLHRILVESHADTSVSAQRRGAIYYASLTGLIVGWGLSVLIWLGLFPQPGVGLAAVAIFSIGVVTASVSAVPSAIQSIREWKSLETETILSVQKNIARWHRTIFHLRESYTQEQLSFAERYVSDVASQLRGRVSLFIGALEKVGVIPMLATTAITLANFSKNGTIPLAWWTAAAVAGVFYVFALRLVDLAFTFERFALILDHAAMKRE